VGFCVKKLEENKKRRENGHVFCGPWTYGFFFLTFLWDSIHFTGAAERI
jgi:hypothetical protein